jgi:murein endopeptidase
MRASRTAVWTLALAAAAIGNALLLAHLSAPGFAVAGSAAAHHAHPKPASTGSDLAAVDWRHSTAVGEPWDGSLRDGVLLPPAGHTYVTWDMDRAHSPNRASRRWGTDTLVRTLLHVLAQYARAHPAAPRVVVGDLSLEHGGYFGHLSHQNGLDVDVYYPRADGLLGPPDDPSQIDHALAQDLVNRFVRAGAQFVFVGPNTGLTGPKDIVQVLDLHDNHMHVRIPNPDAPASSTKPGSPVD